MSNTKLFNGFVDEDSYKRYRAETNQLESILTLIRLEEERGQISYWLKRDYASVNFKAVKILGYLECLWDFDIISEDALDGIYDAYSLLVREAEERIDELSEQK